MTAPDTSAPDTSAPVPEPPQATAALLVDTENLFYEFGYWAFQSYERLRRPTGLHGAVQIVVDEADVLRRAHRALDDLVSWCRGASGRELVTRRSYGKDDDPGVRSVQPRFARNGIVHTSVPPGRDLAELALIDDFESLLGRCDTFVFGGEDHRVRDTVLARVTSAPLRFLFVVPDRNTHTLARHATTTLLNQAEVAVLRTEHGHRHYFVTLNQVAVPVAASRRAAVADRARRAPVAVAPHPSAPPRPEPAVPVPAQIWVDLAFQLTSLQIPRPTTVDELAGEAWRDALAAALGVRTPQLVPWTGPLAVRLQEVLTTVPAAARQFEAAQPGQHAAPGAGWRTTLAAAALYCAARDGDVVLQPGHPVHKAYRSALGWIVVTP